MRKFYKILSALVLIMLCVFLMPTEARAEEAIVEPLPVPGPPTVSYGACGENLTWRLDYEGTLTISGTGAMTNGTTSSSPWFEYQDDIKAVVIGDGVTTIGKYAFYNCDNLTSVTIPDSVTTISEGALYGCVKLTTVAVSDQVTSIGTYAFGKCTNLMTIMVSAENTEYSSDAQGVLYNKNKTTLIQTPGGITSCTIPGSVSSIGNYAFTGSPNITTLTIPNSLTNVGAYAFYNCENLTDVTYCGTEEQWNAIIIGDSNEYLLNAQRTYCTDDGDTSIIASGTCGENLTWTLDDEGTLAISGTGAMKNYSFSDPPWYQRKGSIKSVVIADGVTSIGDYAFHYCNQLIDVSIPDSVKSIGKSAFTYCSKLTALTIPNSVTTIGDFAFSYCENLSGMIIPDSVAYIGSNSFAECHSLSSITVSANNSYYSSDAQGVLYNKDKTVLIKAPGTIETYTIPEGVISLSSDSFRRNKNITEITIPKSLEHIAGTAFEWCDSLKGVYISDIAAWCNISFDVYSFENSFPEFIVAYGNPLYYAKNLYLNGKLVTKLIIPEGTTQISDYAFVNCDKLTAVTIPEGVNKIGIEAFYRCTMLKEVTIPKSVTEIAHGAFSDCENLKIVHITDIAAWCSINLKEIDGPPLGPPPIFEWDSIDSWNPLHYGGTLYLNGEAMTELVIPEGVQLIGPYAFGGYTGLTKVVIPISVTKIGVYAFDGCTNLTDVVIPDSVTNVGAYAFYNCENLTDVTYCGTEEQWNAITIEDGNVELNKATRFYHDYNAVVTAPTCTKDGYTTYTCALCGNRYIDNSVSTLGHVYNGVVTAPTCTAKGYTTYTCSLCGDTFISNEVDVIEHPWDEGVPTAPTCTEDGYMTYTCTVCGHSKISDNVPTLGHVYNGVVTAPTCIAKGYTTYTCTLCGDTYIADEVAMIDHAWDEGIATPPTCTKDGYITRTCTVCGDSRVFAGAPTLGHVYNQGVVTEPTCTTKGYTTYTCTLCGDTYTGNEVDVIEHAWDEGVPTAPTCTEDGYMTYTCTVCGHSKISDNVPTLGHVYNGVVTAPTCIAKGYTTYTCTLCGDTYIADEVAMIDHAWDEGVATAPTCTKDGYITRTCTVCGDSRVFAGAPTLGHVYNQGVVTEPTCTTKGYTTYTCTLCGDTYTGNEVDVIEHPWDEGVPTAPTCTEDGYMTYTCTVCGHSKISDNVPTLGHVYNGVVTAPTCIAKGYTTYTCTLCGDTYIADEVAMIDHAWDEGVATAPTCTKDGYTIYTCTVCGSSYANNRVPTLGHAYNGVVTAPTCMTKGYTTYTCSLCGDAYTANEVDVIDHTYNEGEVTKEPTPIETGIKTYTCTACGETKTEEIPVLTGIIDDQTLVFRNSGALNLEAFIGAQFSVSKEIGDKYQRVYVEIIHNGETKTLELQYNGSIYYAQYGIAAKQMVDELSVQLYAQTADATFVGQSFTGWSVKDKAVEMLLAYYDWYSYSDAYAERCDLAAALLNYGTQAQKTFGYCLDNFATDGVKEEYLELIPTTSNALESMPSFDEANVQAKLYNPAFVLDDVIKASLTFAVGDTKIENYKARVTINGVTEDYTLSQYKLNGTAYPGYAYIIIDSIVAADLRQDFSVTIMKGETAVSTTYTFSMENMASKLVTSRPEMINAMMHYSDAAYALFREK